MFLESARPPRTTPLARAWKAARALCGMLVLAVSDIEVKCRGGLGRRKKLAGELFALEGLFDDVGDAVLDGRPWENWRTVARHAPLLEVTKLRKAVAEAADSAWALSAKASFEGWKKWSVEALGKGARAAHAYSRAANAPPPDPTIAGLPLAGAQSMKACMSEWRPRWTDPDSSSGGPW